MSEENSSRKISLSRERNGFLHAKTLPSFQQNLHESGEIVDVVPLIRGFPLLPLFSSILIESQSIDRFENGVNCIYPHFSRRAYVFRISSPSPLFSSTVSSEAFYIQDNLVSWLLYPGNRVLDNIDINPRVPICNDLLYRHYVTDMSGLHMLQCDKADYPRAESVNSNKIYSEESTVVGMQASGNWEREIVTKIFRGFARP